MTTLVSLPVDILDRILTFVTDFRTLSASISTCTKLRSVYEAHPNSIRKAVGLAVFGSRRLFSAAVKTLRIERALDDSSDDFSEDADWIQARIRSVTAESDIQDISWSDMRALEERARVCMGLETVYSQGFKDKLTLGTSRLTPEESEAFRMALLRIWYLLCITVSNDATRETWESFDVRVSAFYGMLSDQELYEFQLVWQWLDFELDMMAEYDNTLRYLAVDGLDGFLERCETDGYNEKDDDSEWEVDWSVEEDLENIWQERRVDLPRPGEAPSSKGPKPILASINGQDDACAKCNAVLGLELFNCQNWSTWRYFHGRENSHHLWFHVPRTLRSNSYESDMFVCYLANPMHDFAETQAGADPSASQSGADAAATARAPIGTFDILRQLFNLATVVAHDRLRAHLEQDGWAGIAPDDWLCQPCALNLINSRLWIWWYAEKAAGRVRGCVLRQDCWYGYECTTQMKHDGLHARKLNHLALNTYAEREAAKASRRQGPTVQSAVP